MTINPNIAAVRSSTGVVCHSERYQSLRVVLFFFSRDTQAHTHTHRLAHLSCVSVHFTFAMLFVLQCTFSVGSGLSG